MVRSAFVVSFAAIAPLVADSLPTNIISAADKYGVAGLSLFIVVVLWRKMEAMEARQQAMHKEQIDGQTKNAEKLDGLLRESIQAQMLMGSGLEAAGKSVDTLTDELKRRPCALTKQP